MQLPLSPLVGAGKFIINIQPHILGIILDILSWINYKNSATYLKKEQLLILHVIVYHHILKRNGIIIYYFMHILPFVNNFSAKNLNCSESAIDIVL
jgi:hypothetical protein